NNYPAITATALAATTHPNHLFNAQGGRSIAPSSLPGMHTVAGQRPRRRPMDPGATQTHQCNVTTACSDQNVC
ncbi:hypothetical protein AaE_002818, partial [Aphanomyces astaci]